MKDIYQNGLISDNVQNAIETGYRKLVAYLNDDGLYSEGVFANKSAKIGLFNTFEDFGSSQEISKRLSPIMEKGIAHFTSIELAAEDMRLRSEDGDGYDFVLEYTDGIVIDYIELKITTKSCKDRIDTWTLNKNSLVKVPLHLLVAYRTQGTKITQCGVYLANERSNVVERNETVGSSHAYAGLKILPSAMTSNNFVKIIGDISQRGLTSRPLKRPHCIMEQF